MFTFSNINGVRGGGIAILTNLVPVKKMCVIICIIALITARHNKN